MSLLCPVCRASNDAGPPCRRCRADLSLLAALEARRDADLAAAARSLAQGRADAAFAWAVRADIARRGVDSAQMLAAAALLRRDFVAAWLTYRRARNVTAGQS